MGSSAMREILGLRRRFSGRLMGLITPKCRDGDLEHRDDAWGVQFAIGYICGFYGSSD